MKKTLAILSAAALLFAACDKIEPADYTIGTGSSSDWENANARRAFVEKYTGPKCSNCPRADVTLDAAHHRFGDKLVIITVNHPTGQGVPFAGEQDLRTEDGTAWSQYMGISELPSAYLNRGNKQYTGSMDDIVADIENVVAETPLAGIEVEAAAEGSDIAITVDVELYNPVDGGLTVTLVLTEDSLKYKQMLPDGSIEDNYVHNHMLRDVITDTWGNDIPMTGIAGEHKVGHFSYTVTNSDIKIENCHIVALLSRKDNRAVINCAECRIQ